MVYLPIVDERNRVIGIEDGKIVHEKALFHRHVYVFVFNSKGEILLQRRSANKTIYPLFWDLSTAEHLEPNESYLAAAKRGLNEELGISGARLVKLRGAHLQKNEYGALKDYEFAELYKAVYDGEIKIDKSEVEEAGFFPVARVEELRKEGKLTPWFREEWEWCRKKRID